VIVFLSLIGIIVAILGVVEFLIWLILSYYPEYDKGRKEVFAQVHFALFYTAIFNALQTLLVASLVGRISRKLWVQTEALDLSSYVEIREEFDRINVQASELRKSTYDEQEEPTNNTNNIDGDVSLSPIQKLGREWRRFVYGLSRPALKRRYDQLLVQVRFHELRIHFIEAYDLPKGIQVSDYLMKCEIRVLMRLVHVSIMAWLLLTVATNLLYYILGIATYETGNLEIMATTMIAIYFACIIGFVGMAIALLVKMTSVFDTLMHQPPLWNLHHTASQNQELAQKQLNMFWFREPKMVIVLIQFMQFGYAVLLSCIIIFLDTIREGRIGIGWYLVPGFLSYAVFVYVVTRVIPRYTLCTNLGQLVNTDRLHETVSAYHLEQSKKQLESKLAPHSSMHGVTQTSLRDDSPERTIECTEASNAPMSRVNSTTSLSTAGPKRVNSATSLSTMGGAHDDSSRRTDTAELLASLVKLDTDSLRDNLPESDRLALSLRESRRNNRKKSSSDGVKSMRIKDDLALSMPNKKANETATQPETKDDTLGRMDTTRESLQRRRNRGLARKKSVSDGVALMSAMNAMTPITVPVPSLVDIKEEPHHEDGLDAAPSPLPTMDQTEATEEVPVVAQELSKDTSPPKNDKDYLEKTSDDVGTLTGHEDSPSEEVTPETKTTFTISDRIRQYYMGRRFRLFSNVFGTLVAFFLVGQRVEAFISSQNIVDDKIYVSFALPNAVVFWSLFAWMVMFIMTSCCIFYFMGHLGGLKTSSERKAYVAAIVDIVLCSVCLILFCVAESQRCCYSSDSKADFGGVDYKYGPAPCACPPFGSRLYGGLGNIEPFVSLILLRVFRFWVARTIVNSLAATAKERLEAEPMPTDPFAVFSEPGGPRGLDDRGTIGELWQIAVVKYPEIAEKYGELSGELLRVMLGVPIDGAPVKEWHAPGPVAGISHDQHADSESFFKTRSSLESTHGGGLFPEA